MGIIILGLMVMFMGCNYNIGALVYGAAAAPPQVPCYFIFGDSLVDNGNNNVLETTAKVNHLPYGIDFPHGPTGRFSNGRNIADFIAEHLGFDNHIPPYVTAQGQDFLNGVNYASGGAGILDESGQQLGARFSLGNQIINHQTSISKITTILGNNQSASEHLSKCMYSVGMGSNDYINNYFMPEHYQTSQQYNPDQYAEVLIQQYSQHLRNLYDNGARKVAVFGLGPIGCAPFEVKKYNEIPCVTNINVAVVLFNEKLKSLVVWFNREIAGAHFIYVNTMAISMGAAAEAGLKIVNTPCCKVSTGLGEGQCLSQEVPCDNRADYAFFDAFHPTEAANVITARRAYTAESPMDTYPLDIRSLAQL